MCNIEGIENVSAARAKTLFYRGFGFLLYADYWLPESL
jgi:hypothetical protein